MKKIAVPGIIGGVLYTGGFLWQLFELIRNLISDTEDMPWQIYSMLFLLLAVLASYLVIYLLFFAKQIKDAVTKKRIIVMLATSGVTLLWCGIAMSVTLSEFLSFMSFWELFKKWATLLLSPSLFMQTGSVLILIMSVIMLVSAIRAEKYK